MVINDWITVSPDSGCNNGEVILTIKRNTTTVQREYTVPIYLSDGSVKYIDVVQPACSSEPGEINIPDIIYFSYLAGDYNLIDISGKGVFEVTSYPDYIKLSELSGGTATGSYSSGIGAETIQDNNTNFIKEGSITFETTGVKKDLTVRQYRKQVAVDVKLNENNKKGYITVSTFTPSSSTTKDYDITSKNYRPKIYDNGWTLYENYYGQVNRIQIHNENDYGRNDAILEILIDLCNFDGVVNIMSCSEMFRNCQNMTTLTLKNFSIDETATISYMFENCDKLTTVDLQTCPSATQNKILAQLQKDLSNYTWTLADGVITRS